MTAGESRAAVAESDNARLQRLLALSCACRSVLARATCETALREDYCRQLVSVGGYATATLAPAGDSPAESAPRIVLPLKSNGEDFGFLLIVPHNSLPAGDESELLQVLAEDLAFCLHALVCNQNVLSTLNLRERALESSSNGIMITSAEQLEHPITYVNPAFERITGYPASEVIGKNGRFLVRDDLNQKDLSEIRSALRDRREGHAVLRNYRKDGSLFWNELRLAPVLDEAGAATTHFISVLNDVTERVQYAEQLEFQATHDVLTGLANRSLLGDRINQGIARAKRDSEIVGVMLIDLDRFKVVNDGLGHTPGDMLLREIARRLNACVRDTDTVARLGGDEFVVVLTGIVDPDNVALIASKILKAVNQPLHIEDKKLVVTASIGIALFPRDGNEGDLLLRNADLAMYRVKEHGRNSYRFYLPEMHGTAIDRLDMESDLRRALEADELVAYYQPKVDIASGRIVGAEALVRWIHPRIGIINPLEFIPLAEETGLIIPVGETVLRKVAEQLRSWRDAGLPIVPIAVNISPRQFRQENLASTINRILLAAGISGELIDLELTESMVMVHAEAAAAVLHELKTLGCRLYLDDFGTGYSSLAYLKRFPIDALKIDRSFIVDLTTDGDDAAIAGAIIAMAHSLGIRVVAEGVEHNEQLDVLKAHGCDEFQGYYFARPMPAEQFAAMLRKGSTLDQLCP